MINYLEDQTEGKLVETIKFSREIKNPSLIRCIKNLRYAHKNGSYLKDGKTIIYNDFADKSFYFVRYNKEGEPRGNGGIIFHGTHDNGGNGGAPTFSVNLIPVDGWQIHT